MTESSKDKFEWKLSQVSLTKCNIHSLAITLHHTVIGIDIFAPGRVEKDIDASSPSVIGKIGGKFNMFPFCEKMAGNSKLLLFYQVGAGFNRDKWEHLERYVRGLTKLYKNVYVCTGPLYLPKPEPDGKNYVRY